MVRIGEFGRILKNGLSGMIVRNVLLLILKNVFVAVAELVALRLVLESLGVVRFGVCMAVGGVVGMVFLLSGTLNGVFCRFLSFERGLGAKGDVGAAFAATLVFVLGFAVLTGLVGGTAGWLYVKRLLVLPEGFDGAALGVFLLLLANVGIGLLQLPFGAYFVATERMGFLVLIGFLSASLSVLTAGLLFFVPQGDRLVVYAALEVAATVLVLSAYLLRCRKLIVSLKTASQVMARTRRMARFFIWSSFKSAANAVRFQGVQLVGNSCAGVAYNAVFGVAMKVGGWLNIPTVCIRDGYTPRLIGLWAAGDGRGFSRFVVYCVAWSASVFMLLAVPAFVFAPELGAAWLGDSLPGGFVPFFRCVLVFYLIDALLTPVHAAVTANEEIAGYQVTVSCLMASGFLFAALALALGLPLWTSMAGVAFGNLLSFAYRVWYLHGMIRRREWHS